jgi:hypothetical protein
LAAAGSAQLARLDAAADGLPLLGGAPLVRFASGGAMRTRWPAFDGAPPGWEGRLDGAGGLLFNAEACGMLVARAERAGAACWDAAPLLACEDRGGSFRLAISTPDLSAADAAAGDLRDCDWVEVEQLLLAPERANEVAALMARIGIPLALPVRLSPCWWLHFAHVADACTHACACRRHAMAGQLCGLGQALTHCARCLRGAFWRRCLTRRLQTPRPRHRHRFPQLRASRSAPRTAAC